MQEGALFIAWGAPIAGRETAALDVFKEATNFYEALRKKNEITGFDTVLLSYIGDSPRGFFLVRGDATKLAALIAREDFIKLTTKASLVCKDVTVAPAYIGETIPRLLDTYREALNTLALAHQAV